MSALTMPPVAVAQPVDDDAPPSAAIAAGAEAPDPGFTQAASFPSWYQVGVLGSVDEPRGIAINAANGEIYATSYPTSVLLVFDAGGALEDTIGATGNARGVEYHNGEFFVAEASTNRVSVLSPDGVVQRFWGGAGAGNGQFNAPCDVGVSASGRVYVVDANNHRIQEFDVNGVYQSQFGTLGSGAGGEFQFACSGASLKVYGNEVFVSDSLNDRIQVFDLDGTYLRQWGATGSANGLLQAPHDIDVVNDMVYVADVFNNRIQVFSLGGVFQGVIPVPAATAVAVDPSGTVLWAGADTGDQIQIFTTRLCRGLQLTQVGTSYDDRFVGTPGADIVDLGDGDDRYRAGDGDDTVCDTAGDDAVWGLGGADVLDGGPGDDTLRGGGGPDTLYGRGGDDRLDGNGAPDQAFGSIGNDVINGQNGADLLRGGGGVDRIRGNTGPDTIDGEADDDDIGGGNGNDTMTGGTGFDKCAGNLGPADAADSTCEQTPGVEVFF